MCERNKNIIVTIITASILFCIGDSEAVESNYTIVSVANRPVALSRITSTEENVQDQINSIITPTSDEALLIANLATLSASDLDIALNELSGSQYAQLSSAVELSNHRFLRRLYDPLRPIITHSREQYSPCSCDTEVDFWLESGGNRSFFNNDGPNLGFKSSGYEIAAGAQFDFYEKWTVGLAVNYEDEHHNFNIGGSGKTSTVLGALYGAYSGCEGYLLGDLILGGSAGKLFRSFSIDSVDYSEKGRPDDFQGLVYVEGGLDYSYSCVLIQPFVGLEGGFYSFNKVNEHGDVAALSFKGKSYGTFDSRLGVHLSTVDLPYGFSLGIDLAWQYVWSKSNNRRVTGFEDFGTDFRIHGINLDRSSFDGGVNLAMNLDDCWSIFATGNGQVWGNATSYDIVGGVSVSW